MFVMPFTSPSANVPAPTPDAVTITGATISSVSPGLVLARLQIVNNGELWKYTSQNGYEQLSASTDWLRPILIQIDPTYEVRYINHTGNAVVQFGDIGIEGTWADMSESRELFFLSALNNLSCTFDLQIRKDGGAVLATGAFSLDITIIN